MEETIELPKWYLLMDTVCLLNYIQGKSPDNFDYKQVEKFVRDKGWWMVITLETLYESIQACTDVTFRQTGGYSGAWDEGEGTMGTMGLMGVMGLVGDMGDVLWGVLGGRGS